MLFAFSRDDGIPGASRALATVSPRYRTPVAAIWTSAILAILFVWLTSAITIAGTPAYSIVVSCTVIFLFLSFIVPITLGLFYIGSARWARMGPWNMGRTPYRVVALLSIAGMALIFYVGIQPPNDWALEITVGFVLLAPVIWFAFENRRFRGPPVGAEIENRRARIAAAEQLVGQAGSTRTTAAPEPLPPAT